MTRELNPQASVNLVKRFLSDRGLKTTHTEVLDLVARLKGYEAWSHLSQANPQLKGNGKGKKPVTVAPFTYRSWLDSLEGSTTTRSFERFPRDDWTYQIRNGDTSLGYYEWVLSELACHYEIHIQEDMEFKVPAIPVKLPNSSEVIWNIQHDLSTRWGEVNGAIIKDKPALLTLILEKPELFVELTTLMVDEMSFVACKEDVMGLLIEEEYYSQEADGVEDAEYSPYEVQIQKLQSLIARLKPKYPEVEFGLPPAANVYNGRPGVWAFVSIDVARTYGATKLTEIAREMSNG
ncbi:hypothetical protein LC612_42490 [Nostoc sp. CHAB 5834]|nr:hypothetical protein [Nostoc sp. CHAB 5834]